MGCRSRSPAGQAAERNGAAHATDLTGREPGACPGGAPAALEYSPDGRFVAGMEYQMYRAVVRAEDERRRRRLRLPWGYKGPYFSVGVPL